MKTVLTSKKKLLVAIIDTLCTVMRIGQKKPLPKAEDVSSILVLELWGIGDVVLAITGLQGLKKIYPHAKIVLLCQKYGSVLLQESQCVDEIIAFKFPWTKNRGKYPFWQYPWIKMIQLQKQIQKMKFDLSISARMDLRNNALLWIFQANHRLGFAEAGGKGFLTNSIECDDEPVHSVEHWQFILNHLENKVKKWPHPSLIISDKERSNAQLKVHKIRHYKNGLKIAVHPGAGHPLRCWPIQSFQKAIIQISQRYEINWIFFSPPGPDDDQLGKGLDKTTVRFNELKVDLRELMGIMSQCDILLCNDSGPMHIAAALNIPVVALFGPQLPAYFSPLVSPKKVVYYKNVVCRPCFDNCHLKSPICMDNIDPELVVCEITYLINVLMKKK